jgi:hypothetical protein
MIATLALLFVFVFLLLCYLSITGVRRSVWFLAGLAFVARVGFAAVNQLLGLIRPADESGYQATLEFVAQQWQSGVIEAPLTVGSGPGFDGLFVQVYSLFLGPIYTLFGTDMLHARFTMALFGTLVVINLYLIGSQLYSHRGGLYAAAITAVFPYWIYLSGILYRDMLIIFLFTLMFYGLIRIQRGHATIPVIALVTVSGLLALGLRLVNLIAIGAAAAAFVYVRTDKGSKQRFQFVAVALSSLFLLALLFGDEITVEELAGRRLWLARKNPASYLTGYAYGSFTEMLIFLPIGTLYFTFVPFPWQTPNTLSILALGQNLVLWYPLALLSVLGFYDAINTQFGWRVLPLLAFAGVGLVGYGLVEGNLGPALRHRSQFQFVFFVLAGIALSRRLRIRAEAPTD